MFEIACVAGTLYLLLFIMNCMCTCFWWVAPKVQPSTEHHGVSLRGKRSVSQLCMCFGSLLSPRHFSSKLLHTTGCLSSCHRASHVHLLLNRSRGADAAMPSLPALLALSSTPNPAALHSLASVQSCQTRVSRQCGLLQARNERLPLAGGCASPTDFWNCVGLTVSTCTWQALLFRICSK